MRRYGNFHFILKKMYITYSRKIKSSINNAFIMYLIQRTAYTRHVLSELSIVA